jgi:hypothetical protein
MPSPAPGRPPGIFVIGRDREDRPMTHHTQQRVDLHYRLAGPESVSPGTQGKTWFFDLPVDRLHPDGWTELLHRIFYDANVKLRRREPLDGNWLALDRFEVSAVDAAVMLAWDGVATPEKAEAHLPWILASSRVVWEYTGCYFVDEAGGYDGMTGNDFSELVLYRALAEGRTDAATAQAFLERLYPGHGGSVYAERDQRFQNLVEVRPTPDYRRTPGATPWMSGPV